MALLSEAQSAAVVAQYMRDAGAREETIGVEKPVLHQTVAALDAKLEELAAELPAWLPVEALVGLGYDQLVDLALATLRARREHLAVGGGE